ncbi:hypothetical protein SAMN05660649_03884 [Desulfotomaculum arcticum]|uniref:Uncharacterized protein n=1 Tax=Desulfotruncus arcticus DSM 17038 TaxID=1121424 RepID=A0A1I2XAF4_9FIRM|nr:hypothetical protein [Desulfotruncus arcticus]SFH10485.1 hypothetical protein SAMN05660649_03884 [Desulfotomaculum arcticum] [Desulfotruncus arcticus DSM 17038]
MDTRIVVRLTELEKSNLSNISDELGLTLSDYVRKRLLGGSLRTEYLNLIKDRIEKYSDGDLFTIKEVLGTTHWSYMSKLERKTLVEDFIQAIEEEELNVDVAKITKKGKCKFVKMEDSGYMRRLFRNYIDQYNEED